MKKLFLTISILFFVGCSVDIKDDDSSSDSYTPPSNYVPTYNEPKTDITSPYLPESDENYLPNISDDYVPLNETPKINEPQSVPTITPISEPTNKFRDFKSLWQNEPLCYQQWYMTRNESFYDYNSIDKNAGINADDKYDTYSGKGVVVAIIDDALDVYHNEFRDKIIATYNINDKNEDVLPQLKDDTHGTHVTGIIASSFNKKGVVGIATNVKIIFIKIGAMNSESEYIEAFNKANELGADIICNSWGTYNATDALKDTINNLAQNGRNGKGTIIIFAAGNDSRYMGNDESAIPSVLGVGASNKSNDRTTYSNYGEELDLLTPGGDVIGMATTDLTSYQGITSNDYIEFDNYQSFIGTSASAPIATGAIALILEANPNLTRTQLFSILRTSADKIGYIDYDSKGHNDYYGYGKLNLSKAIDMAIKK